MLVLFCLYITLTFGKEVIGISCGVRFPPRKPLWQIVATCSTSDGVRINSVSRGRWSLCFTEKHDDY
jgi:hypothetical protein